MTCSNKEKRGKTTKVIYIFKKFSPFFLFAYEGSNRRQKHLIVSIFMAAVYTFALFVYPSFLPSVRPSVSLVCLSACVCMQLHAIQTFCNWIKLMFRDFGGLDI